MEKIIFKDNVVKLINFSNDSELKIKNIENRLIDDLTNWSSSVRLKPSIDKKTIVELFAWKGMSTWWIGRLVHKNSYDSNKWLNRLMIMYICKEFSNEFHIELDTDDTVLIECIDSNKERVNVTTKYTGYLKGYHKNFFQKINNLKTVVFSLLREFQNFLLFLLISDSNSIEEKDQSVIWFRTLFPINWVGDSNIDRLFSDAPYHDKYHGYKSKYIVYISRSKKYFGVNIFSMIKKIKLFKSSSKRDVYFPQRLIRIRDIFDVYISSYKERCLFKKTATNIHFRNLFNFNDLDLSVILIKEWYSIYTGAQQQSKLNAISSAKFFNKYSDGQKIITYGEFFASNRSGYYLTKKIKPNTKFISIQHAINCKNKTFTYFHKDEFEYSGVDFGEMYSPFPDYFFAQGEQYRKILKEFYDETKIRVIGTLKKIDTKNRKDNDALNEIKNSGKRILLLAPSVGDDYKIIFSFFKDWRYVNDSILLLSAHPTTNIDSIKKYQQQEHQSLDVRYIKDISTYHLISVSDIIVSCFSSISIEASLFNKKSVRVYNLGTIPQFADDKRIPTFYDVKQFHQWFESIDFTKKNNKKESDEIFSDYFYSNDGLAANRFWNYIKEIDGN